LLKYFRVSKSRSNSVDGGARSRNRIFTFSLRITREGVLYVGSVFLLSWAVIKTGNNLLFIIVATLLSTIAVSGIVSRNSLRQVAVSLQLPENVFVNEPVSLKVSMKNLKRIFPTFSIRVEDPDLGRRNSLYFFIRGLMRPRSRKNAGPASLDRAILRQAAYFPILRAGEMRSEYTVQSFPRRGLYTMQGFWISTRFPFGFFHRGELVAANGSMLVYPSIQEISTFFHLLPFLPGLLEGTHVGPGDSLFSIRKYLQGESARIIDWKATSKTGVTMARDYAVEEESKFCLILDSYVQDGAKSDVGEVFEKAVSLAASIAAHFLEEGAGIEFLTPREYIPRGTGIDHLYRILRSLAVANFEIVRPQISAAFWEKGLIEGGGDARAIQQVFSEKVFKIAITSKARRSFPPAIWRSSHVIFFDEL
jgi:uncharacterized protein (DUF58 family)